MSHIVTMRCEIKDREAIEQAARRTGSLYLGNKSHQLFAGQTAGGHGVKLKGWMFPAVFDARTGEASYDNYNGAWGRIEELDRFRQAYAVEKARIEARKQGHRFRESVAADGSIVCTITQG